MSSFLCFICHSTVNAEISDETRDKYREIVGMNLCLDSQLCHICCHVLNKLSLFRSICLKRSLEYPVLFSEKGTVNLQKTNIEILEIPCLDNSCQYQSSTKAFQFIHNSNDSFSDHNNCAENLNQYVALEDNQFKEYFNNVDPEYHIGDDNIQNNIEDTLTEPKEKIDEVDHVNNYDNLLCQDEDFNEVETNIDNSKEYENEFNDINDEFTNNCENELETNDDQINHSDHNSVDYEVNNETVLNNELDREVKIDKKKKKRMTKKTVLSIEEQKAVLEARRKEKKYLDAEFKCYNCALPFLFKDTYQTHMMRHEESNGAHQCSVCTLRFACAGGLRAHAALHAGGKGVRRRAMKRACHLCGGLLRDANGLQQHLRRVHMAKGNRLYSCTVCGENFPSQTTLRTHMIKHIRRKFPCTECPSVYSSPYTLAAHAKRHSAPPERHRCDLCGKCYSSRKGLLAHCRSATAHLQSALECPVCSRVCPNPRSLSLHMQAIHSGTKDHACPHCPARYSTRRSLLRHVTSHTHKPQPAIAVCHLCGSSFKGQSKLNRHLKNVCEKAKLEEQIASLYE